MEDITFPEGLVEGCAQEDLYAALDEYIPSDALVLGDDNRTVYVYAPSGGFGIPADVWDGFDAYVSETCGAEELVGHRLDREGYEYHHLLIIKVNGYTGTPYKGERQR